MVHLEDTLADHQEDFLAVASVEVFLEVVVPHDNKL